MSKCNLIHRKHLSLLRVYFRRTGWTILVPRSRCEVFRASRLDHKTPIIVYKSFNPDYFAIENRDYRIFAKFLKWLKENEEVDKCEVD